MTYHEMVEQVSGNTGMSQSLIDRTYRAFWRATREHICAIPMKEDLTEEEFKKYRPNVNIPSIGKLYVTYDRYQRLRNKYKSDIEKRNASHQEN